MMVKKQEEYELDYGKVACTLIIILIGFWFLSHFRISIIPVNEIESIASVTYYDCPEVGLKTDISIGYVGCKIDHVDHVEQVIESDILKRGLILWLK